MKMVNTLLFNIFFHNCVWLICVFGRERLIWLSLPLVTCYIFWLLQNHIISIRAIALPLLIGVSTDSLLSWFNVFQFDNDFALIPLWLVLLWLSFATTFSLSLKFLASNWWFAFAAGVIAMPANYLAGEKLGAVQFGLDSISVCILLATIWGVLLPAIFRILQHLGQDHVRV